MLAATLLAMLLAAPAPAPEDPIAALERRQQELFERSAPAVVHITTKEGIGSGFFVGGDGLVLTNRHVVGDHDTVDVVLHDGRRVAGRVVERAASVDLALVQTGTTPPATLRLASVAELKVGAWVAAIGHGLGGLWTYNVGMISNIYPFEGKRPVFQTQIPLNPGNSGGPILDREGRVVGIVTAGIAEANAINFAIKVDVAPQHLPKLRGYCRCLTILAPAGVPVFVDGRLAGKGPIVVVIAEKRPYEVFAVIDGERRAATLEHPGTPRVDLGAALER